MSRIAYVNGRYLPHHSATVHVEDRGYQFSDGVYEVAAICDGRIIDETGHLKRLKRSLKELRISMPMKEQPLKAIFQEIIDSKNILFKHSLVTLNESFWGLLLAIILGVIFGTYSSIYIANPILILFNVSLLNM